MYLDDAKAKDIILNVMGDEKDEDNLRELDKWIEKEGIDKVFVTIFEMFRDL